MKENYYRSLLLLFFLSTHSIIAQEDNTPFSGGEFKFTEVSGIGYESGVTRRDPSDVIKVGETYYVYYTKIPDAHPKYWGAGYWGASVWCAKSEDEGFSWTEVGQMLDVGQDGKWDSQAVFTPNIFFADGKYYLYYTGVKPTPGNANGEFENNNISDITSIGVAVSGSPTGPFKRINQEPILKVSVEPEKFDSYRVDDASLLYRNGLYWMYYKGRSIIGGPGRTGTHLYGCLPIAKHPERANTQSLEKRILEKAMRIYLASKGTGVGCVCFPYRKPF